MDIERKQRIAKVRRIRLKELRKRERITQEKAAVIMCISLSEFKRYESQHNCDHKATTFDEYQARLLADRYGYNPAWLLGDSDHIRSDSYLTGQLINIDKKHIDIIFSPEYKAIEKDLYNMKVKYEGAPSEEQMMEESQKMWERIAAPQRALQKIFSSPAFQL